jgi:hypothetical protein
MDIAEMMLRLLAKMDAIQEKADANHAKTDINLKEMRYEIKAGQAKMRSIFNAWSSDLKITQEETMAFQETMKARLEEEEPASVEMKPEVAHEQEVPLEDAVVMPVGEPRRRRRDQQHLAAQRRQKKQQKRTQNKNWYRKDLVAARRETTRRAAVARRMSILLTEETSRESRGSRKRLVAARRGTTRCAEAARHKDIAIARNYTWDKIERGTRRLRALRKRRTAEVLHGIPRDTEIKSWTLWRGRPPPKRKRSRK